MDVVIDMDFASIKGQEEEFKASMVKDLAKGIMGDPSLIQVGAAL